MDKARFLQKFKTEADSQLLQMSQRLVDLERTPGNPEIINEIFRLAHTLKGNANMLNLKAVSSVAHQMETIFGEVREGRLELQPEMTDVLFEAIDGIQGYVNSLLSEEKDTFDASTIIAQLSALVKNGEEPSQIESAQVKPALPVQETQPVVKPPEQRSPMQERFQTESHAQLLLISQRLVDLERTPDNENHIREIFRAAHTLKGNAAMMGYVSVKNVANEMEEIFMAVRDRGVHLKPEMLDILFEGIEYLENAVKRPPSAESTATLQNRLRSLLASEEQPEAEKPEPKQDISPVSTATIPVAVPAQTIAASTRVEATTLSVNVSKLDDLMNITGELVLGKMEAESILDKLRILMDLLRTRQRLNGPVRNMVSVSDRDPTEYTTLGEVRQTLISVSQIDLQVESLLKAIFKEYEEHTSHLQNTVDELESNVLSIRMLPISTLFEEFRPLVRNTARALGRKNPELVQTGNEIEVDKKVLEGIRDPLVHLIRNALDHGIEPPEVRQAMGKPEEGLLQMAALQEGGYVYIRISDDGAGIDPEALRIRAIEKGFMAESKARATSDADILNLIYEPGFTTSRIITDNSGRGVGMDVVKKNIERLGGQVSVSSIWGKGTTFTLKVPLTIATSRALLVRLERQLYAIPAPNIEAMLYLSPDQILTRGGRDVVLYGGALVPLVKLADLIGSNFNAAHPIFRWQALTSERTVQELVNTGLSVKTFNGNGYGNGNGVPAGSDTAVSFGDGLTLADPNAYARIQQLQNDLKRQNGRRFDFERMPGVVVGSGDRRFCLLVETLEDEVEIVVKSLSPLLKAPHVNSAAILGDGRVIMILDVPNLVSSARELVGRKGVRRKASEQPAKKRILVVDDSITTRELEKSILEAAGYHIDTADDGPIALDILGKDSRYDLVISDIEMPRMDGFELTSRIKANPNLRHLPVIIVSSLNSEENKRRGISVGAQAYITKGDFNQNNLLNTIEYLTT